jgi:hypothetical protein
MGYELDIIASAVVGGAGLSGAESVSAPCWARDLPVPERAPQIAGATFYSIIVTSW